MTIYTLTVGLPGCMPNVCYDTGARESLAEEVERDWALHEEGAEHSDGMCAVCSEYLDAHHCAVHLGATKVYVNDLVYELVVVED